ncbi:MAG: NAD-dependent epimerase/dehydratase family protein [Adlercreutzia sp.]|nr:NAD-dependent epimerase/dehydratase family protein [Adlercreutzia sp.]
MFDLKEEARAIAADEAIAWGELAGASVLVTGATGLVGSACVRALLERNRAFGAGVRVLALVRDAAKAARVLEGYGPEDGLVLVVGDVETVSADACAADYVLHAACPTASKFFMEHPVETANAIVGGTVNMLNNARATRAKSFVYVSSMEVYGDGNAAPGLDHLLDEHQVGFCDPLSVRSCYPEGKRMAEQYCMAYAAEYGVPAKVARLAQTFGPGIPKDDKRIFAMIARSALAGEDVVLKTTGASTRMYAYTADAVRALLTILLCGEAGCAYNVANPATYSSVRGMAETVAASCARAPMEVRVEVDPNAPYPPEHHLPLDVSALTALGWKPHVGLEEMYRNLMAYLEG